MTPKDFTPLQAKRWVEPERSKHRTAENIRWRLASEERMRELFAAPTFVAISEAFPNSNKAHADLIAILEKDLAALEAKEVA